MKKTLLPIIAATIALSSQAQAFDFPTFLKKNASSLSVNLAKHSYCQSSINNDAIEGHNSGKLVPIASVSKVFTSYFAAEKLGPFFRFNTKLHVTRYDAASQTADIHIEGSDDPYFTFDKVFFMIAELNKQNIFRIEKLTFDENLRIYSVVREGAIPGNDVDELKFAPVGLNSSKQALELILKTNEWSKYKTPRGDGNAMYGEFMQNAKARGIAVPSLANIKMRLGSVQHLQKDSFNKASVIKTFSMKSAPLFRYLKDLNTFSNNYIADQLARIAGGVPAMNAWFNQKLGFTTADLIMYTGSGLDLDNDVPVSQRKDNLATCNAVIKTLKAYANDINNMQLTAEQKALIGKDSLGLMDVMPIAGVNQGTYGAGADQDGAVVFKTGTLGLNAADARSNIAGYVRGETDTVFYGIFFNYNSMPMYQRIKEIRRQILSKILAEAGGAKPLTGYAETGKGDFMSVDAQSKFQVEVVGGVQAAGLN